MIKKRDRDIANRVEVADAIMDYIEELPICEKDKEYIGLHREAMRLLAAAIGQK